MKISFVFHLNVEKKENVFIKGKFLEYRVIIVCAIFILLFGMISFSFVENFSHDKIKNINNKGFFKQ